MEPGIIPAYAGSTSRVRWKIGFLGDHPRVCGEHLENSLVGCVSSGSSPRMRGAHGQADPLAINLGIIPAYAGSTA